MADIVFTPLNPANTDYPPFVVELKAGVGAQTAIEQIKSRNYAATFKDMLIGETHFATQPLAVGIAWDPKTKAHECLVEELQV